ncbi:MAG: response regulator [Alphaproteobacteria bacterium]|nr:MAG: response regulator [Alphaproteobacteria bacterium]
MIASWARRYWDYILCVALLMVCVGTLTGLVFNSWHHVNHLSIRISHGHAVIGKAQDLALRAEKMLAAERGYSLTGNTKFAKDYDAAKAAASDRIGELNSLVEDSPAQSARMKELQHYFLKLSEKLDAGRIQRAGSPSSRDESDTEAAHENLDRVTSDLLLEEQKQLDFLVSSLDDYRVIYRGRILGSIFISTALFVAFSLYLMRKRRRRELAEQSLGEGGEVFRLAIEGASDGFFEWNLVSDKAFYSRQFWDMLGYESDQFPSNMQSFKDLLHPDDRQRVLDYIEQYLNGEISEYLNVFRMRHQTGKWIWINARGKAIYDDHGKPWRLVGAHTDISHIKAYEEKLEKSKEAAEKANRAKTEFLAHMSHEIRTPLTAISGIAEIFEGAQANLAPKQKQLVRTLSSSTASLKDLINDILDFSKIESGELVLDETSFPLSELFEQVVSIFSVKASEKGIGFTFDDSDVKGLKFLGDRLRLRQILINLIGNAIKFTSKGSVDVTVRHQPRAEDVLLHIEVKDTGIGIDPRHFALIFERFKQADSSVSRKYGGTGLGLPISLRLARLMNGDITVQSEPGKGSLFTLEVPLREDSSEPAGETPPPRWPDLRYARILLVEDYIGNIVILSYLLDGLRCRYDVARTGLEALNKWKEGRYDLVLMDVQMPEMDGFTATSQIRRIEQEKGLPHTPVIGMTAHALVGDKEKCIEAGMDAYLSKPIIDAELKAKMLELLARHKKVA